MPFEPYRYLQGEKWDEVQKDPVRLSRARERLFDAYVAEDPERAAAFAAADEPQRQQLRDEFRERIAARVPEFSVTVRRTRPAPSAGEQARGVAGTIVGGLAPVAPVPVRRTADVVEERTPLFSPQVEEELARIGDKPSKVPWATLGPRETMAWAGLLVQRHPSTAEETLRLAQERARRLVDERGLLPASDDADGAALFGREFARRFLSFSGGAGAGPLVDLALAAPRKVARDRGQLDSQLEDEIASISSLSEPSRRLIAFAYGDDAFLKAAGTLLTWAGGAGAVLRGGVAAGPNAIDPLTRQGLAVGAAYDAAAGAAFGPEYAPSILQAATGMEPSRIGSAIEAPALGLVFGTALRAVQTAAGIRRLRAHPAFADLAGLSDDEFVNAVRSRLDNMRADAARPVEPVGPDAAGSPAAVGRDVIEGPVDAVAPPASPAPASIGPAAPAATPGGSPALPAPDSTPRAPVAPGAEQAFLARAAAGTITSGWQTTVKGGRGLRLPATYVVLPRAVVQASHDGETFAANPAYPLTNTRDYGNLAEREKVLRVRAEFDPEEHVTDSISAAVGPSIIAQVTGADGVAQYAVLGGNNRQMAIRTMRPEKRQALADLTNARADRFGVPQLPDSEHELYRYVGAFDLREAGSVERLQRIIDDLNPAPGKTQTLEEMARVDAEVGLPLDRLADLGLEIAPADAQAAVTGWIREGRLDPNLRSQIAESPTRSQEYVQQVYLSAAYRTPALNELRNDRRTTLSHRLYRSMVDSAAPTAVALRLAGVPQMADALAATFAEAGEYLYRDSRVRTLRKAIEQAAIQTQMGEGGALVQRLARAYSDAIVETSGGKVDEEATREAWDALGGRLRTALQNTDTTEDLFGNVRTPEQAMREALPTPEPFEPPGRLEEPDPTSPPSDGINPRELVLGPLTPPFRLLRQANLQPAPVILYRGEELDVGRGYGLEHLRKHEERIRRMGYDLPEWIEAGLRDAQELWQDGNNVVLVNPSMRSVVVLTERQTAAAGRHWSVVTTFAPDSPNWRPRNGQLIAKRPTGGSSSTPTLRDQQGPASTRDARTVASSSAQGLPAWDVSSIDQLPRPVNLTLPLDWTGHLDRMGVPANARPAADVWRESLNAESGRLSRAPAYISQAEIDFTGAPATAAELPPAPGGEPWLSDPVRYAGPLAQALRNRRRVSSIVADYFSGRLPDWSIEGAVVSTPEDFAVLAQTLRSPYAEIVKAVFLDEADRVIHAEILHVGLLNASLVGVEQMLGAAARAARKGKVKAMVWSHNHPSGDPTPSPADLAITRTVRDAMHNAGVMVRDHIITNGRYYYSFAERRTDEISTFRRSLAPWEIVARDDLADISRITSLGALASALSQAGMNDQTLIVYANNKLRLTGIELADHSFVGTLAAQILAGASREGANAVYLAFPGQRGMTAPVLSELAQRLQSTGIRLVDVRTDAVPSWAAAEILPKYPRSSHSATDPQPTPDTGWVRESEAAPFTRPHRDSVAVLKDGDRVPVELAHLGEIRPVAMPELVAFARQLTGSIPTIRRLHRARGTFNTGTGEVSLHPQIFANPYLAASVLAHEIGHLVDWLPDKTIKRGNLLGHLATLREFVSTTLDQAPAKVPGTITPKIRRRLRGRAERENGPRPPADDPAGRAQWRDQVAARYRELLAQEMRARGLVELRQIREEMVGLSEWWKPIPEDAPAWFREYRASSVEVYADWISVLLNAPGKAQELAPTAWQMFWAYLSKKPAVRAALHELQAITQQPWTSPDGNHVLARRVAALHAGFARGDEVFEAATRRRDQLYGGWKGWLRRLRHEHVDVYSPILDRAKGTDMEEQLAHLFDEHPFSQGRAYVWLKRMYRETIEPLESAGVGLLDFGEYLFFSRVLNERADDAAALAGADGGRAVLANPLGHNPETARQGLDYLQARLGPEKWDLLERSATQFRTLVGEVVRDAVDAGLYRPDTWREVIEPRIDTYATFAVVDHLDATIPASIRRSVGTLKDIANPASATIVKMLSVWRASQRNRAHRTTRDFLQRHFAADIKEVKVKPGTAPADANLPKGSQYLSLLEAGSIRWYQVPEDVVAALEGMTSAEASAVAGGLQKIFSDYFYPFFISKNPRFGLFISPIKDLGRTTINAGTKVGARLAGEMLANYATMAAEALAVATAGHTPVPMTRMGRAARAYIEGTDDVLADEMLARSMLLPPQQTFYAHPRAGEDILQVTLERLGLVPRTDRRDFLERIADAADRAIPLHVAPFGRLMRGVERANQIFEVMPKLVTFQLSGEAMGQLPPISTRPGRSQVGVRVRNHVGVPNFRKGGKYARLMNAFFPFANVALQGFRADAKLLTGQKSRAGWLMRFAAVVGIPTILQVLGEEGAFGDDAAEVYRGIGEYTRENYLTIPVGHLDDATYEFGRRSVYVRVPIDESARFLRVILRQGVRSALRGESPDLQHLLSFGGGEIPGVNVAVSIAGDLFDYAQGNNPIDDFRGAPVVSQRAFEAGGWESHSQVLFHVARESGVTNWITWDREAGNVLEATIASTPVLNAFLQTTDAGYRQAQQEIVAAERRDRARLFFEAPANARELYQQYYRLRGIPTEQRNTWQAERFAVLSVWRRHVWMPYEEVLIDRALDGTAELSEADRKRHWRDLEEATAGFLERINVRDTNPDNDE